jgi:hypothetical protein
MSDALAARTTRSPFEFFPLVPRAIGPAQLISIDIDFLLDRGTCPEQQPGFPPCPPMEAELSVHDLPAGITACVIVDPSGQCHSLPHLVSTSAGAQLVLSAGAVTQQTGTFAVQAGTYNVRLHAAAEVGAQSKTIRATFPLTVHPFSLEPEAQTLRATPGASDSMTLRLVRCSGFAEPIEFEPVIQLARFDTSFDPNPTAGEETRLLLNVAPAATPGVYVVPITARQGPTVRSETIELTVPSFSLGSVPLTVKMRTGSSVSVAVPIERDPGFTRPVQLELVAASHAFAAIFSPNPATGSSAIMALTAAEGVYGRHDLTLRGTLEGGFSVTAPVRAFVV